MTATVRVPLTQGKFATVDAEDAERIMAHNWYAQRRPNGRWYACRFLEGTDRSERAMIYMHREIVSAEKGNDVDHWDKDGLNNTRKNLRECGRSQNNINRGKQANNTTGYKGVTFVRSKGKYQAQISLFGKHKFIGLFNGPYAAAIAYDEAAYDHYGQFAELNFPM